MVLNNTITKEKELSKSILKLDARGFLWVKFKSGVDFDLQDAVIQEKEIVKFCNGKKMPFIVDGRIEFGNISNDAREYLAKSLPLHEIRLAQALLIESLGFRLIANFYIKFNRPNNPVKVFSKEEEAIAWALTYIK